MKLDLGSLKQVKEFATNFKAKQLPLHILMNSAGVMANPFGLTVDKLESQFATNHLGHFLLTKLLLPELEASAPARVVTVTSAAAFIPEMLAQFERFGLANAAPAVDFDKLGQDYEADYSPFKAYGRSKLANVLFTRALDRRLSGKKIYANTCHPGGIKTNLGRHVQKSTEDSIGQDLTYVLVDYLQQLVMLTPPRGAITQLYLATSPDIEDKGIRGQYYRPQALRRDPPSFSTEELEERLWSISEKLVSQHFIFAQSEPRLFLSLCNQDAAAATRILGNTSGIVGLLSLVVNQAGGKLSDRIGRKPGFLVGPLSNILLGWCVFKNANSRWVVAVCRILRLILTTFSNTVMCNAALADVCSSNELALAMSRIQTATGLAMLLTPFIEGRILLLSPSSPAGIRYVYAAMAAIAAVHTGFVASQLEETLDSTKRTTTQLTLSVINPFGFLRLFAEGSKVLQKLVVITTLQMFLEGKNLSDVIQTWIRDHLKWSVTQVRNFIVGYGLLCTATGASATPWMLRNLSARGFTTATNLLNAAAFGLRGLAPSSLLFLTMMVPMLPGVNGASATALKAVAQDIATSQGFGKGEFSAW
ncbi:TIC32, partial [Symbiodinium pilosum]